jgi:uncharacterized phosphosugar-binding protein
MGALRAGEHADLRLVSVSGRVPKPVGMVGTTAPGGAKIVVLITYTGTALSRYRDVVESGSTVDLVFKCQSRKRLARAD